MSEDQLPIKLDVKANLKADSKDLVKAWEKLLDTIKAPFSWWANNRAPVAEAKAEIKAARLRVEAVNALMVTSVLTRPEAEALVLRADDRELLQRIRQQQNIEAIVQGAAFVLPEAVNTQPVDEDWLADFFEQCKNVSNERMQVVWSKILAGEVATPGAFSRRTLSFVRQLSEQEANLFTKFCSFVWHGKDSEENDYMVMFYEDRHRQVDEHGIGYSDLMELDALGLITLAIDHRVATYIIPQNSTLKSCYFDESYVFCSINRGDFDIKRLPLTNLGKSLKPISGAEKNEDYKSYVINLLEARGIIVIESWWGSMPKETREGILAKIHDIIMVFFEEQFRGYYHAQKLKGFPDAPNGDTRYLSFRNFVTVPGPDPLSPELFLPAMSSAMTSGLISKTEADNFSKRIADHVKTNWDYWAIQAPSKNQSEHEYDVLASDELREKLQRSFVTRFPFKNDAARSLEKLFWQA